MSAETGVLESAPDQTEIRPRVRRSPAARIATALAMALCVAAVPVVIILGAVRFAFSWQPVYTYAIATYHPEDLTGVPAPQLELATRTIRSYFSNRQRDLDVTVIDAAGDRAPLFNDREISHMRDVKALVLRLYRIFDAAVLVLVLSALAMLALRLGGVRRFAASVLAGSALTAGLLLAVGGTAAVGGFDQLFLEFHLVSFSNNFWELDPTRDHLVQLFPQGYWLDVTVFVLVLALTAAVLCAAASITFLAMSRPVRKPG